MISYFSEFLLNESTVLFRGKHEGGRNLTLRFIAKPSEILVQKSLSQGSNVMGDWFTIFSDGIETVDRGDDLVSLVRTIFSVTHSSFNKSGMEGETFRKRWEELKENPIFSNWWNSKSVQNLIKSDKLGI